jgi:hypothetical protein
MLAENMLRDAAVYFLTCCRSLTSHMPAVTERWVLPESCDSINLLEGYNAVGACADECCGNDFEDVVGD